MITRASLSAFPWRLAARFLLTSLPFVALLITTVAASSSDAGTRPKGTEGSHEVRVPVLLDGERSYQPGEFNVIYQRLRDRVTFRFVVLRGEENLLYAFTSDDRMKAYLATRGRIAPRGPAERGSGASPGAIESQSGKTMRLRSPMVTHNCFFDPRYSLFWEHIECDGAVLAKDVGSNENDLRTIGWNDRISSLRCTYHSQVTWCTMFEHILFGGAAISFENGVGSNDLRTWGWNDRASSLIIETTF